MSNWNSYVTVVAATVVDNIDVATEYYSKFFKVTPLYQINHIQNYVDLKDILKHAPIDIESIDASVRFLNFGSGKYVYEVAEFHNIPYDPTATNSIIMKIYVDDLADTFAKVKSQKEVKLLSNPHKLSTVFSPCKKFQNDTKFFVDEKTKKEILSEASNDLGGFIFIDRYNVHWEVLGNIANDGRL